MLKFNFILNFLITIFENRLVLTYQNFKRDDNIKPIMLAKS